MTARRAAPLPSRRILVAAATTLLVFLASLTWLVPLVLVALPAVVLAGAYVRRWWFPLLQAAPLLVLVPLFFVLANAEGSEGSDAGLAVMMSAAAQSLYVILALAGWAIGALVAATRARSARRLEPRP